MWVEINQEEYLNTYNSNYKIIEANILDDKFLGKRMEVVLGRNNEPELKHTINPLFEVRCWKWTNNKL